MDAAKFFQSKGTYLNATHFAARDFDVTIKDVQIECVGQDQEQKLVVYFDELPRGLALNKTNYETLFDAFGPETDDWLKRRVTLFSEKTKYDGKDVDGVRIRVAQENCLPREQRSKPKPPTMDDKIPF